MAFPTNSNCVQGSLDLSDLHYLNAELFFLYSLKGLLLS